MLLSSNNSNISRNIVYLKGTDIVKTLLINAVKKSNPKESYLLIPKSLITLL